MLAHQPNHRAKLVVAAARMIHRALQPLQRGGCGQGLASIVLVASFPQRIKLIRRHRQKRIPTQIRMIAQILVAQRQSVQPLRHQLLHLMLHEARTAPIDKTSHQPTSQDDRTVGLPQQQDPTVARDESPAKVGYDLPRAQALKLERSLLTVCLSLGAFLRFFFLLHTKTLTIRRAQVLPLSMRDAGYWRRQLPGVVPAGSEEAGPCWPAAMLYVRHRPHSIACLVGSSDIFTFLSFSNPGVEIPVSILSVLARAEANGYDSSGFLASGWHRLC